MHDLYSVPYFFRFCLFVLLGLLQVPWLQRIRRKLAGQPRFLAALPLLLGNLLLPLIFDQQLEIVSRCISALLMAWLTNFKVSHQICMISCSQTA